MGALGGDSYSWRNGAEAVAAGNTCPVFCFLTPFNLLMGRSRSSQKPEGKGAQEVLAGVPTAQRTGNGSVWGERRKGMGLRIA